MRYLSNLGANILIFHHITKYFNQYLTFRTGFLSNLIIDMAFYNDRAPRDVGMLYSFCMLVKYQKISCAKL